MVTFSEIHDAFLFAKLGGGGHEQGHPLQGHLPDAEEYLAEKRNETDEKYDCR
jgi:hypothetical protein